MLLPISMNSNPADNDSVEGSGLGNEDVTVCRAIAGTYREALDGKAKPSVAALYARQTIEQIAAYLVEREIGQGKSHSKMLDHMLKQLGAKNVFSQREAVNFGTVQIHANSMIHPTLRRGTLDSQDLKPCLASLEIVVAWFFIEYVRRPEFLGRSATPPESVTPSPPDAIPINSTATAHLLTSAGTSIGDLTPVWRGKPMAPLLKFDASDDLPAQHVEFRIEGHKPEYFLGRAKRNDGTANDFSLPATWRSVSHDQGLVTPRDGDVFLKNTSGKNNVLVRGELLADGRSRALRHNDSLNFGHCTGTFLDGRYYAAVPGAFIDPATGLLSRLGLVAEIGRYLGIGAPRVLFVIRCPGGPTLDSAAGATRDPERAAVDVAQALHLHDPRFPVARIGADVAALLLPETSVDAYANVAQRAAGAACVTGYLALSGKIDQAGARLEGCLGALNRIAIAGREPAAPEDLSRYALVLTPLASFGAKVRPLFDVGGGAVIFALGEIDRLDRLAPQVLPVLELELLEMLGARMGPPDVVSIVARGLIALGTPGAVERIAQEIGVAWHARGSVTANQLEVDRSLSAHLLAQSDLDNLAERARSLVSGGVGAFGVAGFPAPVALAVRALDDCSDVAERVRSMVAVVELTWKLLAFVLVSSDRASRAPATPSKPAPSATSAAPSWPSPWRDTARKAARQLEGLGGRLTELAMVASGADGDGPSGAAMALAANAAELVQGGLADIEAYARIAPGLERALREIFDALGPLRGWTLVGVESVEVTDLEGTTQRIEYVDYTGPNARGSRQTVSLVGSRMLGRFVYLVRWNEGLAIALEPFVRRSRHESTGETQLFLAEQPIVAPGRHTYVAPATLHETQLLVTAKQLGIVREG